VKAARRITALGLLADSPEKVRPDAPQDPGFMPVGKRSHRQEKSHSNLKAAMLAAVQGFFRP
jgi:hypothetical protein